MKTVFVYVIFMLQVVESRVTDAPIKIRYNYKDNTLMLKCEVTEYSCCRDIKEVEFFKNTTGMCTVNVCNGGCSVPQSRDDTKFYSCGCNGDDLRSTYLLVTKPRLSDISNWTCKCFDKSKSEPCVSQAMGITHFEEETQDRRYDLIEYGSPKLLFGLIASVLTIVIVNFCILCFIIYRKQNGNVGIKRSCQWLRCLPCKENDQDDGVNIKIQTLADNVMSTLKGEYHKLVLAKVTRDDPNQVYNVYLHTSRVKWCSCGNCQQMKIKTQNVCCRDRGVKMECFSKSERFRSKCLSRKEIYKFYSTEKNKDPNDETAGLVSTLRLHNLTESVCKEDGPNDKSTHESLRFTAYVLCRDILPKSSKDVFYPIPSCCKMVIKEKFPYPVSNETSTTDDN